MDVNLDSGEWVGMHRNEFIGADTRVKLGEFLDPLLI